MKKFILRMIVAALSGSLLTLAFAPLRADTLALVSLVIFFCMLNRCLSVFEAFFISSFFGFGFFATSLYWIYIAIHLFTQSTLASLPVVIALVILLSFLHIIPFGVCSYIFTRKTNNLVKILIYPALWTLFEIVKANLLWGGFPWVSLGYSQTESPLIWFANVGGVYLVTYITAFIASLTVFYILKPTVFFLEKITARFTKKIISRQHNNFSTTLVLAPEFNRIYKLSLSVVIVMLIYFCGYIISKNQPVIKTNQKQKVILIQGNFIQKFKWDNKNIFKIRKYYEKVAGKYKNSLLILPENAIPEYREHSNSYFDRLAEIANKNNNAMLIGSLSVNNVIEPPKFYNSSAIIGKGQGIYNKHHLVPFAEYFPVRFFAQVYNIGPGNLDAANKIQPVMSAFGLPLVNFICYEVGYPEQVRDQLQSAKLISIISDDGWFGDSIALDQQLQISQVRAIENYKYVLTTTNNGITSIIKPNGEIETQLPKNTRAALKGYVYLNDYQTLWMKVGMLLVLLIITISIIFAMIIKYCRIK